MDARTAYNNRKKDAQLLYIIVFGSSRLLQALEQSTFVGVNRDDFFAPMSFVGHPPCLPSRPNIEIVRRNARGKE